MRKRCQALVLAGILGVGTLGSAYTAYAAGPGEMPVSVGASAAGGQEKQEDPEEPAMCLLPPALLRMQKEQTRPIKCMEKVNGVYQMPDGRCHSKCALPEELTYPDGRGDQLEPGRSR